MDIMADQTSEHVCQVMTNTVGGKESLAELLRRRTLVFLRRVMKIYRKWTRPRSDPAALTTTASKVAEIQERDLVRVRSLKDIELTLDYRGFTKGCMFMSQMAQYCDQEFQVAGKVEKFFDEARCRTLRCKNLVVLDGVHCNGESVGGCDRKCFLFWRAEWLQKMG
jgi:hypothetical protein